jgi:hypothetical protein
MPIAGIFYGTLVEADTYFSSRLHEKAWTNADTATRQRALVAATRAIDSLNFKGAKTDASQDLQFPRDGETTVPEDIRVACYEIAYELLSGRNAETEVQLLAVTSQNYSSVRTTYSRDQVPLEHLINGIVSLEAWKLLKPYLRDANDITLSRVS